MLKPKPGATRKFVYAKCCSDGFAGQFASLAIGTSTGHQRVKPQDLLAMPCTVPARALIQQSGAAVAAILRQSRLMREKIRNLRHTRDLVLPRLLSGKVALDVSETEEEIESLPYETDAASEKRTLWVEFVPDSLATNPAGGVEIIRRR